MLGAEPANSDSAATMSCRKAANGPSSLRQDDTNPYYQHPCTSSLQEQHLKLAPGTSKNYRNIQDKASHNWAFFICSRACKPALLVSSFGLR